MEKLNLIELNRTELINIEAGGDGSTAHTLGEVINFYLGTKQHRKTKKKKRKKYKKKKYKFQKLKYNNKKKKKK